MNLVYNSDVISEKDFSVEATDRAFQYGDGLFETIRYERSQLWFWSDHYDRLTKGMVALQLNVPASFSADRLHQSILELLSSNELIDQPARIKIQVWRRPGGLYTPMHNDVNVLISARSGHSYAITSTSKVPIYNAFRLSSSPISSFKTVNALPYVLAGLFKQQQNADDVILLDTQGHLAECIASNLFWVSDNTLCTPSLMTGCIDGIARRQLLRAFPNTQEGLFLPDVLLSARIVFAANVMGIQVFQGELDRTFRERIEQIFVQDNSL
jgi:branched-chain amino acid aminotransferase/4-amino-4-deoxychorismate lyase